MQYIVVRGGTVFERLGSEVRRSKAGYLTISLRVRTGAIYADNDVRRHARIGRADLTPSREVARDREAQSRFRVPVARPRSRASFSSSVCKSLESDPDVSVREADAITTQFERELLAHVPAISMARIRARPHDASIHGTQEKHPDDHGEHGGHGHHAPGPVTLTGKLAAGRVEIIDTAEGERMSFTASRVLPGLQSSVEIDRENGRVEALLLERVSESPPRWMSTRAPDEPHGFTARLWLRSGERTEELPFTMSEPENHHGAAPK